MELVPGLRVQQYELIRELGRGGMGQVWAARDTKLGRRVAMKFLITKRRDVAERFLTEARATAQCNHDNIVIIHEVDELGDLPYMVLEYLEGQTLREVMGPFQGGHRMTASRAVELALPIARALARAHELGIVHRDLKPENVFVAVGGQVKVLDFGIAKALGTADDHAPLNELANDTALITRDGALVGTLPYMSPEQLGANGGVVDHRTDLWALGIMLFELLAGRHPVEPLSAQRLITIATFEDEAMLSLATLAPEAPDALQELVRHLLCRRATDRVATAAEVVERLDKLLPHRAGRPLAEGESPYPGLTAFQEADADRFFGRDREIARMVTRIREHPLTAVIGPSGAGKSSFVRAGVAPALKALGEHWDFVTLRPGRQPLAALASVVMRLSTKSGSIAPGQAARHDELAERFANEPGYLGTLLRARAQETNEQLLLFVDQFEELYTLVPDKAERLAFTAALAGVADDAAAPLRVVVSMRSDFLDRIAEDPRFMDDLSRGLVFLQPPDADGLRDALVQPVEMVGYHFESRSIVGDMLDALAGTSGALPLLQFAASRLWETRDRQRKLLTVASYRAIGGITGALASHADQVIVGMSATAQRLTQKIFRRLVTPERTRAIVEIGDLDHLSPDRAEVGRVVDQLVAARLLVIQTRSDGGGGTVEIVHESLIDRWPMLRRWLDEEQEDAAFLAQLAAAAKQWDAKGNPAGLLWTGEAMEEARRWYGARPRDLPARDQSFLDAVLALARRGTRRRRAATIAGFVVLGVIASGAMVAAVRIRGAERQASANEAEAKANLEKAQQRERERDAAEARKGAAERERLAAEQLKATAEQQRAAAEAGEKAAQLTVEQQNAELAARAQRLEAAVSAADAAAAEARAANVAAQKANAQLKAENDRKAAEIDRLKKEALTRTLK